MKTTLNYLFASSRKIVLALFVFIFILLNVTGSEKSSTFPGDVEELFPPIKGILEKSDQEKVSSFKLLRQDILTYLKQEMGQPSLVVERFTSFTNAPQSRYILFFMIDSTVVNIVVYNAGVVQSYVYELNHEETSKIKSRLNSFCDSAETETGIDESASITSYYLFRAKKADENEYICTVLGRREGNNWNEFKTILDTLTSALLKRYQKKGMPTHPKNAVFEEKIWTFYEAHEKRMGLHLYAPEEEQEERKAQYMKARDESMKKDPPPPVDLKLDKETAIKIAETVLVKKYGERVLEQRPWKVTERDDHFVIIGTLFKDRTIARGGVADIVIDKTDGRVISITHSR